MERQKTDEGQKRSSGKMAGVLGAALRSLVTVITIVLLALQVVELGLILEKVSALEQLPARGKVVQIPAPAVPTSPLAEGESETADVRVELLAVEADGEGLTLSLEVHQYGPAALLFQRPVLQGKQGKAYQLDPDSLEEARFALLDAVTRGRAEIELRFTPAPGKGEDLTLIFNRDYPVDDLIAPHIETPIKR